MNYDELFRKAVSRIGLMQMDGEDTKGGDDGVMKDYAENLRSNCPLEHAVAHAGHKILRPRIRKIFYRYNGYPFTEAVPMHEHIREDLFEEIWPDVCTYFGLGVSLGEESLPFSPPTEGGHDASLEFFTKPAVQLFGTLACSLVFGQSVSLEGYLRDHLSNTVDSTFVHCGMPFNDDFQAHIWSAYQVGTESALAIGFVIGWEMGKDAFIERSLDGIRAASE